MTLICGIVDDGRITIRAWVSQESATLAGLFPVPRVSRRTLLQAGTAFAGASWLSGVHAHVADVATAKQVIFLFMWGGPSQIDTFDPKPAAPAEIRGPFAPIATNVPGIELSQHFRQLSQHAEKFCLVRSLTHDDPAHLSSAHTLLTGQLPPVNKSDAEPPSDRDSPHLAQSLGICVRLGKDCQGA